MYNNFETCQLYRFNRTSNEYEMVGAIEVELSDTAATNTTANDILTINHIITGITEGTIYAEDKLVRADGSTLIVRSVILSRRYFTFECMRDEFRAF